MKHLLIIIFIVVAIPYSGTAQLKYQIQNLKEYYPIAEAKHWRYMSSYVEQESILFEATPTIRLKFYNDIIKSLAKHKNFGQGYYLNFSPHLRMYQDNSLPVKTPSYKIGFGVQHMHRIKGNESDYKDQFISYMFETGHFSNGQANCAYSALIADGSTLCDSVYSTISDETNLTDILNRESGNFSTNFTKLGVQYSHYDLDEESLLPKKIYKVGIGYELYHDPLLYFIDLGGYTEHDIKIYGKHRFSTSLSYDHIWSKNNHRIRVELNSHIIAGAHGHVDPLRLEFNTHYFPYENSPLFGYKFSVITGHDNYNYRFVDAGTQWALGICWDVSSPIKTKITFPEENSENIRDRVIKARNKQEERYQEHGLHTNAQMENTQLREHCQLDQASTLLLKAAMNKLKLSARAYDRILKVGRTIADLADADSIKMEHLAEAIQYRSLDREEWGG